MRKLMVLPEPQELLDNLQAAGVPATMVRINDAHAFRTPEGRRELARQTLDFFNHYLAAAQ